MLGDTSCIASLTFGAFSSFIVKTNRDPWNSKDPTRSQLTWYLCVNCLPMILTLVGKSEYIFSIFCGSLVPNKDLRFLIRYLIATFLWACPSTGIFSHPVSIVNWRFPNRCQSQVLIQKFCGHFKHTNYIADSTVYSIIPHVWTYAEYRHRLIKNC